MLIRVSAACSLFSKNTDATTPELTTTSETMGETTTTTMTSETTTTTAATTSTATSGASTGTSDTSISTVETSAEPTPEPTATPAPTASPEPTPTLEPTPVPFGEAPDQAGHAGILFDIYISRALVDLNQDGMMEEVEFVAGAATSELRINGASYTVNLANLAQRFGITDVDGDDAILELAFTDPYAELADSEKAYTYVYWWSGTQLIKMGGLMDVKFDGAWRTDFDPADHFDGNGMTLCLARTEELTDIWYIGHYLCDGTERKLKEKNYSTQAVYPVDPLVLKSYIVLLNNIDSSYFTSEYYVIWDYASGYSTLDRNYTDSIVSFIPQEGETLEVIRVYGKYWFKLQASDGKAGWLKCMDKKVQGYYQVMGITAFDIFDGILIAG